jgi:hypothetical protein
MHFGAFSPLPCAVRREIVARAASSGLTMHQPTGTLMHRSGKGARQRDAIFINSKPRRGLPRPW